jgi:hypothetical protein
LRKVGTAQVELDSVKVISEDEKELVLPGVLAREGILQYAQGRAYRSAPSYKGAYSLLKGLGLLAVSIPRLGSLWILS